MLQKLSATAAIVLNLFLSLFSMYLGVLSAYWLNHHLSIKGNLPKSSHLQQSLLRLSAKILLNIFFEARVCCDSICLEDETTHMISGVFKGL